MYALKVNKKMQIVIKSMYNLIIFISGIPRKYYKKQVYM